jgi:hypothetical protein
MISEHLALEARPPYVGYTKDSDCNFYVLLPTHTLGRLVPAVPQSWVHSACRNPWLYVPIQHALLKPRRASEPE